jgi:hypothetical protein
MNLHKQAWVWIIAISIVISSAIFYFADEIHYFSDKKIAVIVNEEEMTRGDFNLVLKQVNQNYSELEPQEANETALEMAVDQLLLVSYAKKMGLFVAEEEMEEFYAEVIMHEPEIQTKAELFTVWEDDGFNQQEMERQVKIYLLYDKIYEAYVEKIDITDEEIEEAYKDYISWIEEVGASEEELMTIDEIREELISFITQEKALAEIEKDMEEFKESSLIERML